MKGPFARLAVLLLGLGLMGGYLWLNQSKALMAYTALRLDRDGPASSTWALALDKQVLISRRLPPTGIFDGVGRHQINIEPVPAALYDRIRAHRDRVTQVYDDKARTSRLIAMKDFLVTQIADRRVYLVRREDARTIAGIVWNERRQIRDVARCVDPALCRHLRMRFGPGWGRLIGPYLATDIDPRRRGLPRGRWVDGPMSPLAIDSDTAGRAVIDLKILRFAPTQKVMVNGHVLKPANVQRPVRLAGRLLLPTDYRIPIEIMKGRNLLKFAFSNWLKKSPRPHAGYVYGLTLAGRPAHDAAPPASPRTQRP